MPYSRAEIVRRVTGLRKTPRTVATTLGVSERTVAKSLARYRTDGEAGLADRSLRPRAMPSVTPADVVEQVITLRRQRLCGRQIAKNLSLSPATVSRILRKVHLSRMRDLGPTRPAPFAKPARACSIAGKPFRARHRASALSATCSNLALRDPIGTQRLQQACEVQRHPWPMADP